MPDMPRRRFLKTLAAGASGLALSPLAGAASSEGRPPGKPNLLFVFPDQYRKEAMGFMNADPVRTPNLDRFASQGLCLTHCVSNHPVCSPYRAMLMTGQYPHKNGVHWNCTSQRTKHGNFLKESAHTFSDALYGQGYSCGYIGKWHLDGPEPPFVDPVAPGKAMWNSYTPPGPKRHHFDFWHAYGCSNDHLHPHYWIGNAKVDARTYFDQWSPEHEADVAIEFIENKGGTHRDAAKPWALFIAMNPPHPPYSKVPQKFRDLYKDASLPELLNRPNIPFDTTDPKQKKQVQRAQNSVRDYFAAVTGIDQQFARILKTLDERGIADNTIVVFTADHGEMMGSHGRTGKNVCYNEAFSIPFVIRWPGKIKPGRDDLLLGTPDNMPTLLGLMGLAHAIPDEVEGSDYSSILLGNKGKRPESAWYIASSPTAPASRDRGIKTHRHTLVVARGPKGDEEKIRLYDDIEDPYQMRNIAKEQPKVVAELAPEINRWLEHNSDPWTPFTPKA